MKEGWWAPCSVWSLSSNLSFSTSAVLLAVSHFSALLQLRASWVERKRGKREEREKKEELSFYLATLWHLREERKKERNRRKKSWPEERERERTVEAARSVADVFFSGCTDWNVLRLLFEQQRQQQRLEDRKKIFSCRRHSPSDGGQIGREGQLMQVVVVLVIVVMVVMVVKENNALLQQ